MRSILKVMAVLAALVPPGLAAAQERPVVVELFTSQGCSSCPPADEFMHQLAMRQDVIALALHVDYWDYIGWKDSFADPAYTARQRGYARAGGRRMVYTPQMIIDGEDHVVGNRPQDVEMLIGKHERKAAGVTLSALRDGNRLRIRAVPDAALRGPVVVQLIRYRPKDKVEVLRGENAGRTLSYSNIVTGIEVLRRWTVDGPLEIEAEMTGSEPGVVLIQGAEFGPVVAAARVK